MNVQEMLDIASRYDTKASREMMRACRDWGSQNNVRLTFDRIAPEGDDELVAVVTEDEWTRLKSENSIKDGQ